jgi:hypothetical protein
MCMVKARHVMRLNPTLGAVLLAGGLASCVAPPPPAFVAAPQAAPAQLVAVPGPGKTPVAFQQDDAACRTAVAALPSAAQAQPTAEQLAAARSSVVLATEAGAGPVGTSSTPPPPAEALPPGVAYLRCMTSRQNQVQQLAPAVQFYAYYPAYPIYPGIGFGYPFFYDDVFAFRFGYGFGFGGYGRYGYGGYGGYRGGYGGYGGYYRGGYGGYGGYRGGYGGGYGGGFHGGGFGGGFHGGGFGGRR